MSKEFKPCKILECTEIQKKSPLKGFCRYHYQQHKKGWLTFDGEKTNKFKTMYHREKDIICKYEGCGKKYKVGFKKGFCNAHYRQYRKGYVTLKGTILKRITPYGIYKTTLCAIPGCTNNPRRNKLCNRHYTKVYTYKTLNLDGTDTEKVFKLDYCQICKKTKKDGKITKGFCRSHYTRYFNGTVDSSGKPTDRARKSYRNVPCKICGKINGRNTKGFCVNHYDKFLKGYVDLNGRDITKDKRCSLCSEQPMKGSKLCLKHFHIRKFGILNIPEKIEKPKCSLEDCWNIPDLNGLCTRHRELVKTLTF